MFKDAIAPNSCNVLLFVNINDANPAAVVIFVNKVMLPIFCIIIDKAPSLFFVFLYSL